MRRRTGSRPGSRRAHGTRHSGWGPPARSASASRALPRRVRLPAVALHPRRRSAAPDGSVPREGLRSSGGGGGTTRRSPRRPEEIGTRGHGKPDAPGRSPVEPPLPVADHPPGGDRPAGDERAGAVHAEAVPQRRAGAEREEDVVLRGGARGHGGPADGGGGGEEGQTCEAVTGEARGGLQRCARAEGGSCGRRASAARGRCMMDTSAPA
jgi:hypothetical protein